MQFAKHCSISVKSNPWLLIDTQLESYHEDGDYKYKESYNLIK